MCSWHVLAIVTNGDDTKRLSMISYVFNAHHFLSTTAGVPMYKRKSNLLHFFHHLYTSKNLKLHLAMC
jgi:hypothetical protein